MRLNPLPRPRSYRIALLLVAACALWSCGSEPARQQAEVTEPTPEQPAPEPAKTALELPPSQFDSQFAAAEQALATFNWMGASEILATLPADQLRPEDMAQRTYLQARIDYVRGDQAAALDKVSALAQAELSPALRYRVNSFHHYMLDLSGDSLQAARIGDSLLTAAPADHAAAWKRNIWRNLQRTDTAALSRARAQAGDARWSAWLDLALIGEQAASSQPAALQQWREQHPEHPAASPLPGGMDYLLQGASPAAKVALVLPLSGRLAAAGRAVLDGYLAASYADGGSAQELLVIDQAGFSSASAMYDQAVGDGATMIVGPLQKESVAELANRADRTVPVLALNRADVPATAGSAALVQLALAPEDEAQRLAELAYGRGARRALILASGSSWGKEVTRSLSERWTALGGTVVSTASYGDVSGYSGSVKEALGIEESEARANRIREMLATKVEFAARRRADPDIIFLLSRDAGEARSLKPLLAYHYAGNLPVYSLSSIYDGAADLGNRDLDGIYLVEMPWLLGADRALRDSLESSSHSKASYTRLNALGADAYRLQAGFARLQSGPDALLRGGTGLLSMDPALRIHRETRLAKFDGGALKPL